MTSYILECLAVMFIPNNPLIKLISIELRRDQSAPEPLLIRRNDVIFIMDNLGSCLISSPVFECAS